mgnify:CR=1 FL=1
MIFTTTDGVAAYSVSNLGIGLSLFLACLGLDSGAHFIDTIMKGDGLLWIALGFIVTVIPVVLMGLISLRISGLDFGSNRPIKMPTTIGPPARPSLTGAEIPGITIGMEPKSRPSTMPTNITARLGSLSLVAVLPTTSATLSIWFSLPTTVIDWNKIDSSLTSKILVISKPELNGKKLGSLRLLLPVSHLRHRGDMSLRNSMPRH